MSEWISPSLEFLLLALKVAGIVGAFIGFSAEGAHAGAKSTSGAPRRKRVLAFAFLSVAIGAELCDSLLKRLDSKEQALRFERLAHPLGTIRAQIRYKLSFKDKMFERYITRQDGPHPGDGILPPDQTSEPAAASLFAAVPSFTVFLYRKSDSKVVLKNREPDLSFDIEPTRVQKLGEPMRDIADERRYQYYKKEITAWLSSSNAPDDRFSNGAIISTADLIGAELEVRSCPQMTGFDRATVADLVEISKNFTIETISIEFPGRREFQMGKDMAGVRRDEPRGLEACSHLYYKFPETKQAWEKSLVP